MKSAVTQVPKDRKKCEECKDFRSERRKRVSERDRPHPEKL